MKDADARERIEGAETDLKDARERLLALEVGLGRLSIRRCKKCGRETVQIKAGSYWEVRGSNYYYIHDDYDYACLSCGAKWECTEKTVCTEVKPKPTKKKTQKKLGA